VNLTSESRIKLLLNFKATFKVVGIIYFVGSFYIFVDSYFTNNLENLLLPLYLFTLLPVIVIAVLIYSKLESVQFNLLTRSLIFSILSTFTLIIWYVCGNYFDTGLVEFDSIIRTFLLSFVVQALFYTQIPTSEPNDV